MKTLTTVFHSSSPFASALCFAGFYVISLGSVVGMIEATQLLLGMI